MMLIDSHCHLNRLAGLQTEDSFDFRALDQRIQAAQAAGVEGFLSIAVDPVEWPLLRQISYRHSSVLYSIGTHPCEDLDILQHTTVERLLAAAQDDRVWAIGETGLDYHYSDELKQAQQASFERHIEVARLLDKPLIVHTRDARADTIAILRATRPPRGVLHCFTEDWETAKAALDLGWFISFSGIITFKSANMLRDVVKQVPLDRLLIETDSPYLAPVPYRGKPNEPQYLPYVAACVADLHGITVSQVIEQTGRNFLDWNGRCWPRPGEIAQ